MKTPQQMIRLTYDLGTPPHLIASILNLSEKEVEREISDYDLAAFNIERDYEKDELPKVQKAIHEMKADVPESDRYEMRRRYLLDQIAELKSDPTNPRLRKVMLEAKIFTGKIKGISPEQVVRAREYPLTDLVKSRNGMAKCPFHSDKTPSMDIRKNFYHCYGCGEQGDVIDFVMKTESIDFQRAIARLT